YFTLTAPATTLPPTLSLHDALPICYSSKHPQQFVIKITSKKQGFATNPVSCLLRKYVAVCIFKLFEDFIRPTYAGKILMPYSSRSEEHTSELQSRFALVCRLLLEKI